MSGFLKHVHKSECLGTLPLSTFDATCQFAQTVLLNSCNSGINIEAHSLGSQQLADHFPMRLPIEADLDPFKTQVLEHPCPRFVKHSHLLTYLLTY